MATTKKELLKLSKVALIKECKKYNMSTTGTKSDMIARILTKCKPQKKSSSKGDNIHGVETKINDNNKSKVREKSKMESTLSFKTRYTHLIIGYIRKKILNNKDTNYDSSISMVIIAYIGSIFLKFDAYHNKYKTECIKEKGMRIKRGTLVYTINDEEHQYMNMNSARKAPAWQQSARIAFGSKYGFIGRENVYKWKIRLITDSQNWYVYDYIGITDDIGIKLFDMKLIRRTDKNAELMNKHVIPYCIHTSSTGLIRSKSKEVDITLDFNNKCVEYKLGEGAFKQNVKQPIEQDKMYYMIIFSQSNETEYKLTVD